MSAPFPYPVVYSPLGETRKTAAELSPEQRERLQDDKYPDKLRQGLAELLLTSSPYRQAGRISALAEMEGRPPPFSLRYPFTHQGLYAGGGAMLGGLAGMLPALILHNQGTIGRERAAAMMSMGTSAGIGLGGFGGAGLGALIRNRAKKREQAAAAEELTVDPEAGNPLAALMSGLHQQGRSDALLAAQGEEVGPLHNPGMTALNLASRVPVVNWAASPAWLAGNALHYRDAQNRRGGAKEAAFALESATPMTSLLPQKFAQEVDEQTRRKRDRWKKGLLIPSK